MIEIDDGGDGIMSSTATSELEEFHRFVGDQLQRKDATLSPEDALELFRQRQGSPDEFAACAAAVQRALAQADRGEGIPLHEAMQRLREKHELPRLVDDE